MKLEKQKFISLILKSPAAEENTWNTIQLVKIQKFLLKEQRSTNPGSHCHSQWHTPQHTANNIIYCCFPLNPKCKEWQRNQIQLELYLHPKAQQEHRQRGRQRTAAIRGFENLVDKKVEVFTSHSMEKNSKEIHEDWNKTSYALLVIKKKMLINCFHAHWSNLQQDKYWLHIEITREVPVHSNNLSTVSRATMEL